MTLEAIYKRLKDGPVGAPDGDAVTAAVDSMLVYIAERTGETAVDVRRMLEAGETVHTRDAMYRAADRYGNLLGTF